MGIHLISPVNADIVFGLDPLLSLLWVCAHFLTVRSLTGFIVIVHGCFRELCTYRGAPKRVLLLLAIEIKFKLSAIALLAFLCGRSDLNIRNESRIELANGRADKALKILQAGLRDHPGSRTLQACLIEVQDVVVSQAVEQAGALRSVGKLHEAEVRLQGALALDPSNDRLLTSPAGRSSGRRGCRVTRPTRSSAATNCSSSHRQPSSLWIVGTATQA